jgi:hypothetical protein
MTPEIAKKLLDARDGVSISAELALQRAAPDLADAYLAEVEARKEAESERNAWRNDFLTLEGAIVGGTGLSAIIVAKQARLFKPRAEKAEALVRELVGVLQWCSGSADFGDGGIAREGWLKLAVPALARAKEAGFGHE